MPRVSHSVCLKHGKREKRDLELEESELSLLCYAVMGIFVRFFFQIGIKREASSEQFHLPARRMLQ